LLHVDNRYIYNKEETSPTSNVSFILTYMGAVRDNAHLSLFISLQPLLEFEVPERESRH